MFDIGGPEFLVIAIVALVVLGPERLPEVMRRAGQFYRQARQMLNEYTGEAQRMFEEGLREVNDVSNTLSSTWQDATADAAANTPPPPLLQLPSPLQAPDKAPAAGPWMLPAWYRDNRADLEPLPSDDPSSPFALPAARPESDDLFDDFGIGGPALMGPLPTTEAAEPASPPEPFPLEPLAPEAPALPDRRPPAHVTTPPDVAEQVRVAAVAEPALAVADEGELFASEDEAAAVPANGKVHQQAGAPRRAPGEARDAETVRQETLIELYRTGDITLEKAAEFLNMTPGQFRGLLRRK